MPLSVPDISDLPPEELAHIPAAPPPPGLTSNLVNPYNIGVSSVIIGAIFLAIACIAYLSRMYAKIRIIKKLTFDDLTITLGLLCFCTLFASTVKGDVGPVGKHLWNISILDFLNLDFIVASYIYVVIIPLASLFIKASFLLMYLQIFKPLRWMRIASNITLALLCAFYMGCSIFQFVVSTPPPGEDFTAFALSSGPNRGNILSIPLSAVGLAFDIAILVLPIAALNQVQISQKRKTGLRLLFLSGGLACIASVISLVFRIVYLSNDDFFWQTPIQFACLIELGIGITCASVPSIAKLLNHHIKIFFSVREYFSTTLGNSNKQLARTSASPASKSVITGEESHPKPDRRGGSTTDFLADSASIETETDTFELGNLQSVRTFIVATEPQGEARTANGIYVTNEVRQQS